MAEELDLARAALLFVAGAGGGALNAVVGGGSFLSFPALLAVGVPAVPANATSTLALWPGGVASAVGYRRHLAGAGRVLVGFGIASFAGGLAGALLLLRTSNESFRSFVPWLLLGATLLFTFGPLLTRRLRAPRLAAPEADAAAATAKSQELRWFVPALAAQLAVAVYGGYFGGGMGILMLAVLSALGLEDIHFMNGVKNLLATIVNGVALVVFVRGGAIAWAPGLVALVGATAGGYAGAALATRAKPERVRAFVTLVAWGLTGWFFVHDFARGR